MSREPFVHPLNVAGCCDGHGQVHHGFGALSYVTLCQDPECVAWRDAGWSHFCGEAPAPPSLREFMNDDRAPASVETAGAA